MLCEEIEVVVPTSAALPSEIIESILNPPQDINSSSRREFEALTEFRVLECLLLVNNLCKLQIRNCCRGAHHPGLSVFLIRMVSQEQCTFRDKVYFMGCKFRCASVFIVRGFAPRKASTLTFATF
jgi:hypothetical protein